MIDKIVLKVKSGKGGDGHISFRREKYVNRGGPDGGDGGDGGSVYVVGDSSLTTLLHLARKPHVIAENGGDGGNNKKSGRRGKDVTIRVPQGTLAYEKVKDSLYLLGAVTSTLAALEYGGAGGKGNVHFCSSSNQEPLLAEQGELGAELILVLELILQADVAIVGKPSVGKSSLLATITRAKPQIGGYPFTTTHPVLGTRELRDTSEIWLELPALIAGAHEGRGLGNSFLRHAMAARLLFLMLDGASEKLLDDYFELREELAKYNSRLSRDKPQILAVNKCDLPEVQQRTAQIQAQLDSLSLPIFFISAKSGEGVLALLDAVEKLLKAHPTQSSTTPPLQSRPRPTIQPPQILKSGSMYAVKYRPAERLAALSNSADWRVLAQLRGELKRMSVGKALERAGVRPGDKVRVGRALLEW